MALQLANVAIQGLDGAGPLAGPLGGLIPGLFGGDVRAPSAGMGPARLFAKGAAFRGGRVIPFAKGGVVSGPTMFPMSSGVGLMAKSGPEAIMPLRKGPGGRLGVEASGGGKSVVELRLSRDLEARILQEAALNSVKIATRAVATGSPAIVADMRRRDMIR